MFCGCAFVKIDIYFFQHSQEYLTGVVGTFDEKIKAAQEVRQFIPYN